MLGFWLPLDFCKGSLKPHLSNKKPFGLPQTVLFSSLPTKLAFQAACLNKRRCRAPHFVIQRQQII